MPVSLKNSCGLETSPKLFLANTKPYSENFKFIDDFYLNKPNLLDYGQSDNDYSDIYDPDSRVEKYVNAFVPVLPEGFVLAGHGSVSRNTCGQFNGIRSTKLNPLSTLELMFNTCNKLACPTCVRKACNVKAQTITQKIKDYIWFCITQGVEYKSLVPKHFTLNPNYVDKFGVYHENFTPDFSSMKNYHKSIKNFIETYIDPYLDGYVVFYHHHRFKDVLKTELKVMGHFHVIGFGYMPNYDDFKAMHGFIYTNEGYLNTLSDIFRVARYELSHVLFPQKFVNRTSEVSDKQFAFWKKEKDFESWLLRSDVSSFKSYLKNINYKKEIVDGVVVQTQTNKSLHSFHSYFYGGNLSPYNIRYLKCKKKKRTPDGLKKVAISLPMRDVNTNDKVYEIIGGAHFRLKDKSGRWKYYTLSEMYQKSPIVNKNLQIKLFNDRLKFGKLYRRKKYLNWISIKDFKLKMRLI